MNAGWLHGTTYGYRNQACRCEDCREAQRISCAEYRARRAAEGFAGLPHGTRSTYLTGCRCKPCRFAASRYQRAYEARHYSRTSES